MTLTIIYRSTIVGSLKNNYKNREQQNYEITKTKKKVLQSFGVSKPLRVIFIDFLLKKIEKFIF